MNKQIKKEIQQEFSEKLDYDELMNCMRCGFCLPSCPTYSQTNQYEASSPRGRIALMKGVADGIIEPDEQIEKQLNLCLGCRACEPVCPSGVKYGHLLEDARDIIQSKKRHSPPTRFLRNLIFNKIFPYQDRIRFLTHWLGIYQRSGIQKFLQKSKLLSILPNNLATMESIVPPIANKEALTNRPDHLPSYGTSIAKVAFFSGCIMDTMFLPTNNATTTLLQHAGCDIVIPKAQGCCGALHAHSGEKAMAKELAKKNIQAFEELDVDHIIVNAGGCGAMLSEYDHLLKDDQEWKNRAKALSQKVKDFSQILVELQFHKQDLSLPNEIITYQDSCHLRNVMGTSTAPRTLLQSIKGIDYKEMVDASHCCGSAGIYNIMEPEMSMEILNYKMEMVKGTHAQTIVTTNPGCLLQMKLGVKKEGLDGHVRAVHLADLLLEAYNYNRRETTTN